MCCILGNWDDYRCKKTREGGGGGDVFVNKFNPLYMDISWFTYIIKTSMNQNYLRKQTRKEY